jgi:hypothetical protein
MCSGGLSALGRHRGGNRKRTRPVGEVAGPNLYPGIMHQLDFTDLDEAEFEEFCLELLKGLQGFHKVDWRKGTPKSTSPADRGRDIAAEVDHVEVDGARYVGTLVITSGFKSNAARTTSGTSSRTTGGRFVSSTGYGRLLGTAE